MIPRCGGHSVPVSLYKGRDLQVPGQREAPLVGPGRSFSIAFPGISISLGQTFQQAWQLVQVKRPSRTASEIRSPLSRGSRASRISCRIAVGPRNFVTSTAGQTETQQRHSMQSRRGLIASMSCFFGRRDLLFRQERGDLLQFRQEIDNEVLFHREG